MDRVKNERGVFIGVSIATIFLVAAKTFFLMNAIPGSPFMMEKSTPQQIELANAKSSMKF